jgi:hypothetical protein
MMQRQATGDALRILIHMRLERLRLRYHPLSNWKNRQTKVNDNGYVLVYVPEHPKSFCGGWYYEHRLVAEKYAGRILRSWETVHHISENKTENTWRNLFVCTRHEHERVNRLTLRAA